MLQMKKKKKKKKKIEHNSNWPYILDHPYRILITGGSGSGKTNALLNLIEYQNDCDNVIDKIYLYARDPYEVKYQLLINKGEEVGLDSIILELLLNIRVICMIFMKMLKSIIRDRNAKY